jgi:phage baseplate assembly protein gpV
MDRFLNALKAQSAAMDASWAQPRFALVTSVDPSRPAVRVSLQPEGVITGWLPVLSPWVGAGWGLACPPSPGDQVLVIAQEGDAEHGVVVGRAWSDQARPPAAPAGEFWLVHQTGAAIRLKSDGAVHIQGNVIVTGTLTTTGDIADRYGSLNTLRVHYNAHLHPDAQGGLTGTTTQPD